LKTLQTRETEHNPIPSAGIWVMDDPQDNRKSGIRDQGSGIRDQGSGIRDQGSGIRGVPLPHL
jgi:hypothetical protein